MKGRARKMQETTIEVTPEVEQLIQKVARAAVAEYKRQEEKERKRDKYHNTFTLMKCYRDAAFHIENAISDGEQLELKGMTDEQQRTYLESVRRSRFKTLIMTAHIVSDSELRETQTANYFSNLYPIDCAVLSVNA